MTYVRYFLYGSNRVLMYVVGCFYTQTTNPDVAEIADRTAFV